ncbi:MAG: flagellin [Phenylobacterium zucineum]|nr:MAG: flagellin [Phenylobacterium zucineum]
MTISVRSNNPALSALQNLNSTQENLTTVQNRLGSGLAVAAAKDDSSGWAIAQGQRSDLRALAAVKMSLDRAQSIADLSVTTATSVSNLLLEMKDKALAATDTSLDSNSRSTLNNDFKVLLGQVTRVIQDSGFNGTNLLDGSTASLRFMASADANSFLTLSGQNLSLGGAIIPLAATASISTVTQASSVLANLTTSITNVSQALGTLGAQSAQVTAHSSFVSRLDDVVTAGIGNIVDANMSKESARLQALQVQQQLGTQALSIANQAPSIILSLFK